MYINVQADPVAPSLKVGVEVKDNSDAPHSLFVYLVKVERAHVRVKATRLRLVLGVGVGGREIDRKRPHEAKPGIGLFVLFHDARNLLIVEPLVLVLDPTGGIARSEVVLTERLLLVGWEGCVVKDAVVVVGAAGRVAWDRGGQTGALFAAGLAWFTIADLFKGQFTFMCCSLSRYQLPRIC